jgi:hypothetical protein
MSNNGGAERVNLGLLLKVSLAVLGIGALLALCIWVTVQKPSSPADVTVSTSTDPSAAPTIIGEDDTPPMYKEISEAEQPTDEQIWEFETAYVTADPAEQLPLLEKVATPQYISSEYSSESIETNGLVVEVDRLTSVFSIEKDRDKTHCFVTSHLNLNSFRNNEPVLSYQIKHTTLWVNTLEGWKVASEVR